MPQLEAASRTIDQITFAVKPRPRTLPVSPMARKSVPAQNPAALTQSSTADLTQLGTGIVRMWRPLPMRSASTQCSSRSSKSSTLTATSSALRKPQPRSMVRMAWLRRSRSCLPECTARSFLPCSAVSQLPTRTPRRFAPLTLRMPAARSGLSSPQSEASYASLRTAASLRLIVDGAYRRCSKAMR
jgi:hypothetical protein